MDISVKMQHSYSDSTLEVGLSFEVVALLELGASVHTKCGLKIPTGLMR
jgi:hypothetical protein